MKLSKEVLEEGRSLILDKKLDELKEWQDENIPEWKGLDPRPSFEKAYSLGMDGIKLFDSLYIDVDPKLERIKNRLYLLKGILIFMFIILIILGSIGGIVYLFS